MLGQSAGQQATLDAGVVRGKALQHPRSRQRRNAARGQARARSLRCATTPPPGELTVEYEEIPLDDVAIAWERQAASPHVKLILVP